MYCIVKGIKRVDYTKKVDNEVKRIKGANLAVEYGDEHWESGVGYDIIYCGGNIADDVQLEDKIRINYNKYGKVQSIEFAE